MAAIAVACTPAPSPGGGWENADSAPPPPLPSTFSVLSYNVAGLPEGISGSRPAANMKPIGARLNDYDIVLTQENFDWWVPALWILDFSTYNDQLRSQVTHPYRSTQHPGPESVGIYEGVRPLLVGDGLGTLSRFPFREAARVPWRNCFGDAFGGAADCLAMKGFSHSVVRLASGFEVDVYNLHAEAGGSARDQELQVQDFDQLASYIETYSTGRAVIVAGDTNLHTAGTSPDADHKDGDDGADEAIWNDFLERTGLTDVCRSLDCPDTHRIDKAAFRDGGSVDLSATGHAFIPERFIDPSGRDLSDHEPLEIVFAWNELRSGE